MAGQKNALWDVLSDAFQNSGIDSFDVTPREDGLTCRTEEIKRYLELHPSVRRYVILDDCYGDDYSSDKSVHDHPVFVDALKGLQVQDVLKACGIMNFVNLGNDYEEIKNEKKIYFFDCSCSNLFTLERVQQ